MSNQEQNKLQCLPAVPLRGLVAFPENITHFEAGRKGTILALNQAMEKDQLVFLVSQKNPNDEAPEGENLYHMGTVARVTQVMRAGKDVVRVIVEGLYRAQMVHLLQERPFFVAEVARQKEKAVQTDARTNSLYRVAMDVFEEYVSVVGGMPDDVLEALENRQEQLGYVADYIAANVKIDFESIQQALEELDPQKRLLSLLNHIKGEIDIL